MNTIRFLTLFTILSSFFSFNSHAEQYIGCNNCSQYQMYQLARDTAESHVDIGGFNDDIFIVDIRNAVVRGWRISASYTFNSSGELDVNSSAYSISVPTHILQEVKEASEEPIFASRGIDVPASSGFESAWDIARNSSNRDRLDQWFREEHYLTYMAYNFGGGILGVIVEPFAGLEYIFKFEDGSELIMTAPRGFSAKVKLSYLPNSSKDKDGNIIVDAGGSFNGEYTFLSQHSMDDYLRRASQYGIKIYKVSSSGGGSAGVVYVVILKE